jgi:hypothetical protein
MHQTCTQRGETNLKILRALVCGLTITVVSYALLAIGDCLPAFGRSCIYGAQMFIVTSAVFFLYENKVINELGKRS